MSNLYRKFQSLNYCIRLTKRKPKLIWKLMKLETKLLMGTSPLFREIEIATTYNCNLKCIHCSADTLKEKNKECLNLDDYKRIGEECKKYDVPLVTFTGGEPLLDPRLEEIISYFNPESTIIGITTNGTLLNEDKIKRLKKLGIDSFVISIDNPDPNIHDSFRNIKGAFNKTLNNIKLAKEADIDVLIITTIHHGNINDGFIKMIDFAKELGLKLHTSLAAPAGKWANEESYDKYMLTDNDIELLSQLRSKYKFIRRDIDGNYGKIGCPAGTERLCITPTGDIMPCTKIHVSFGNIKEDSLFNIRKKILSHKEFSEIPNMCIAAEDRKFIKKYMTKSFNKDKTLLSEYEFFGVEKENNNG